MRGEANLAYDHFLATYKNIYDKSFPLKAYKGSKRTTLKQPWMTSGLLRASRKKARLYLKFVRNPTSENKKKLLYTKIILNLSDFAPSKGIMHPNLKNITTI